VEYHFFSALLLKQDLCKPDEIFLKVQQQVLQKPSISLLAFKGSYLVVEEQCCLIHSLSFERWQVDFSISNAF
jgi:hypothetical protein